ncbi:uncharacterized protein LOC110627530 [Manihot esculenta]|uniref:Late embryogenesis abundant protein LEA-2 subgroup domain-containing protein n=1 Tax=Manihot esculenta TaxID=3983 RepID=A0A2C9UVR0_MANES|nr:uncharacterized protein LOC110627530 [Manihot esculenta]OAY35144.1 hypothetical protein MANES_12G075800v8 [Manihot esculenta]
MAKGSCRGLKICCGVTAIFLIIFAVIFTSLALTIFKPKDPKIIAHSFGLNNFESGNFTANVTLSLVITIENPNYGSFMFRNSTGYVNYHEDLVAEIPIDGCFVPSHSTVNIPTSGALMEDKLLENPYLLPDIMAGSLNFTSSAVIYGKVSVLKILKLHATAYISCDISIFVPSQDIESTCNSKFKL